MRQAMRTLVVLLTFVIAITACSGKKSVISHNADFDRAFIPALALTGQAKPDGRSVMAVKQLKQQWEVLKARLPELVEKGAVGGRIEDLIMKADGLISARRNAEAHRALVEVSRLLIRQRTKHGIDYFPDKLMAFRDVMEMIVSSSGDPTVVSEFMPEAQARWAVAREAKFKPEDFRFTDERVEALKENMQAVDKVLLDLKAAAAGMNRPAMKKQARLLKKRFTKVYIMFGNFEASTLS